MIKTLFTFLLIGTSLTAAIDPLPLSPLPRPVVGDAPSMRFTLERLPPLPLPIYSKLHLEAPKTLEVELVDDFDLEIVALDPPEDLEEPCPFCAVLDEDRWAPWFEAGVRHFLNSVSVAN